MLYRSLKKHIFHEQDVTHRKILTSYEISRILYRMSILMRDVYRIRISRYTYPHVRELLNYKRSAIAGTRSCTRDTTLNYL